MADRKIYRSWLDCLISLSWIPIRYINPSSPMKEMELEACSLKDPLIKKYGSPYLKTLLVSDAS